MLELGAEVENRRAVRKRRRFRRERRGSLPSFGSDLRATSAERDTPHTALRVSGIRLSGELLAELTLDYEKCRRYEVPPGLHLTDSPKRSACSRCFTAQTVQRWPQCCSTPLQLNVSACDEGVSAALDGGARGRRRGRGRRGARVFDVRQLEFEVPEGVACPLGPASSSGTSPEPPIPTDSRGRSATSLSVREALRRVRQATNTRTRHAGWLVQYATPRPTRRLGRPAGVHLQRATRTEPSS